MPLARVSRSASRDESRPVLTGILVRFEPGKLVMAATDSYRLSVKETAMDGAVPELEAIFETKTADGRTVQPDEGDLVAVLGALERCAAALSAEGEGPSAFLETAARIVGDAGLESAAAPPLLVLP